MARLSDLIDLHGKTKLKLNGDKFIWDGFYLRHENNDVVETVAAVLLSYNWELDEPTVEEVLKDRGYSRVVESSLVACKFHKDGIGFPSLRCNTPPSGTEMTRIIDFLESLK